MPKWGSSRGASFAWLSGDDLLRGPVHNLDHDNWLMGDRAPVAGNGRPGRCHGLGGRSCAPENWRGTLSDHRSATYDYAPIPGSSKR